MNKKIVIAIIIIVLVIIIAVVGYLIFRSTKKKADAVLAAQQAEILRQQLAQNPNMPPQQKQGILAQIGNLAAIIAAAKAGNTPSGTPPSFIGPLPDGGPYTPPAYIPPVSPIAPYGFPLRNGSNTKNAAPGQQYVQQLQGALNAKCGQKLIVDGIFGPKTTTAAMQCIGSPTVSWDQYQSYLTV